MRYCRLRSKVCLTFVRPTFVGDRLKESAPNFPRAAFDWCGWIGKLSRLVGVGYVADCGSSSAKKYISLCCYKLSTSLFSTSQIITKYLFKEQYKIHFKFLTMVFCQTSKLLRDQWGLSMASNNVNIRKSFKITIDPQKLHFFPWKPV